MCIIVIRSHEDALNDCFGKAISHQGLKHAISSLYHSDKAAIIGLFSETVSVYWREMTGICRKSCRNRTCLEHQRNT